MSVTSVGNNPPPISPNEMTQAARVLEPARSETVLPPVAKVARTEPISNQEIDTALEQIQTMMDLRNRSVQFTRDSESGSNVIKVVDSQSGDVIRQMPAEELLAFMRNLTRMIGTFIDETT